MWHGFYLFPVPAWILQIFGTHTYSTIFRNLSEQFFSSGTDSTLIPVLARILPISGTHIGSTIFRNSSAQFFGIRTNSTFSQYSPGFYKFPVLTLIVSFSETRPESFLKMARILLFPVLARILPFSGTHTYSTLLDTHPDSFSVLARILHFPGTRPDSTDFRYSYIFYPF